MPFAELYLSLGWLACGFVIEMVLRSLSLLVLAGQMAEDGWQSYLRLYDKEVLCMNRIGAYEEEPEIHGKGSF